jgi:hypothetical protein
MGWLKEAKELKQMKYGHYCSMCRKLKIEPIPYHSFDINLIKELKDKLK